MSTTLAFPGVNTLRLAARSMAVNITTSIAALVTAAGIYGIWNYVPVSTKRKACLTYLAASPAVSTELLMSMIDSRDPAALMRQLLTDKETSPELGMALRSALTKML
jgi:hypothetical protein